LRENKDLPQNVNDIIKKQKKFLEEIKYFKIPNSDRTNDKAKSNDNIKGFIIYGKIKNSDKYKVLFILSKKELQKRVKDLVEVFLRGIKFQVGGRDYSLTPIFSAVAITKSPLQLFFPNIGIKPLGNNRFEVLGLPYVIENPVMEKVYLNWNEAKIQVDITNINRKEVEPNKKIPEIIDEICNEIFNEKDNSSNNKDSTEGGNNANG
jgi:hypothetical protein